MVLRVVVIILASYFLGNLNGAILISRLLAHDDVRRHGSGNAGFTNFCRNYGSLSGLLVFAIDALKAVGFFPGPRVVMVEEATDGLAPALSAANISDREYFVRARQGLSTVTSPLVSRITGDLVVLVTSPVVDSKGDFDGIVVGAIRFKNFLD